jgi:hypothetical protein
MTPTAAKKQARRESTMYRQGRGWVRSVYDPEYGCNRVSHEQDWATVRQSLADWRRRRVLELTREGGAPGSGAGD